MLFALRFPCLHLWEQTPREDRDPSVPTPLQVLPASGTAPVPDGGPWNEKGSVCRVNESTLENLPPEL